MKHKLIFSFFILIYFGLTSCNTAFAQSEQTEAEIRGNIDWMYNSTNAPTRMSTWKRSVPTGTGVRSIRGPLSAQSCVIFATSFTLAGMDSEALEWSQAGQDHNPGVQDLFANYRDYCMKYIKDKYTQSAATSLGLSILTGVPVEWAKAINNTLGGHKPDPDPAHLRPAPSPKRKEPIEGGPRGGIRN